VKEQAYVTTKKSLFDKVVGDSGFELEVAAFLDRCPDVVSFAKNPGRDGFKIEYQNADGGIANYFPDFLVKREEGEVWVVETKGREDLDDPLKWARLERWCEDASALRWLAALPWAIRAGGGMGEVQGGELWAARHGVPGTWLSALLRCYKRWNR
jgi:hypothetical protein